MHLSESSLPSGIFNSKKGMTTAGGDKKRSPGTACRGILKPCDRGILLQVVHKLRQTRLQVCSLVLVDDPLRCKFVKKLRGLLQILRCFGFVGGGTDLFDRCTHARP